MNYYTLFFSKIGKDVANVSSAAVAVCALRVRILVNRYISKANSEDLAQVLQCLLR